MTPLTALATYYASPLALVTAGCLIALSPLAKADSASSTNHQDLALATWSPPNDMLAEPVVLGEGEIRRAGWGRYSPNERKYFPEFLPALFDRTIVIETLPADRRLEWAFTGPRAALYITVSNNCVELQTQFHDSPGFNQLTSKPGLFPKLAGPKLTFDIKHGEPLRAISVRLDHTLTLTVSLNGQGVHHQLWLDGFQHHQLRLTGKSGVVRLQLLQPAPVKTQVTVNPSERHQTMLGFGGTATPTAYHELGTKGRQRWWEWVAEYNLLCQREYPMGGMLDPAMDNWDNLGEAKAHYYGDNFPNGEASNFEYNRALQSLGGLVVFEFWDFPPWISNNPAQYAKAMVNYCQTAQRRTGQPPRIVGLQNELKMKPELVEPFITALRRGLDEAGFKQVKLHLANAATVQYGLKVLPAYRDNPRVWDLLDYSAVNQYDFQDHFRDPDKFDPTLLKWRERTGDRPFLAIEICDNRETYQSDGYGVALMMGELYQKDLTLADAALLGYCWTLLNIEQPTFGMTRSLFVSDPQSGFLPKPSSNQLRIFGAFSRRVSEGMTRVAASTSDTNLLVAAFAGKNGATTAVLLNRSSAPVEVQLNWPGVRFTETELADPYHQNEVLAKADNTANSVTIPPGGIITRTTQPVKTLPRNFSVP